MGFGFNGYVMPDFGSGLNRHDRRRVDFVRVVVADISDIDDNRIAA
jgi:hypothetical protein